MLHGKLYNKIIKVELIAILSVLYWAIMDSIVYEIIRESLNGISVSILYLAVATVIYIQAVVAIPWAGDYTLKRMLEKNKQGKNKRWYQALDAKNVTVIAVTISMLIGIVTGLLRVFRWR